ncbi:tRNA 2-selenouridine(34) synthase MnmH [Thiomicrorhabdus sp. Kp2]|uniref:tRNA 2-selenouridine(34) synthase MnmH n=1 Tax=Thiomicrorhabdus sp. Kp2 TaxID=1123518 RepID=UPI000428772B|nr:tRNA 2-selenouridine(34) synthase MnmH [Thiomicrorhabdus sp. Kp2]
MAAAITEFTGELPQTDDFKSIVLNQTPLIDVRAPVEFNQGAFASSVNLPLMNDEERHKVGVCYKQHGNAAAVKLGHQLVNESARAPRVKSWIQFMEAYPEAMLYCFRGGMRSKISQQWLQDAGREIVRLKGGYKAFRRYLIDYLDHLPGLLEQKKIQPIVLAGRTGSGKTIAIHQLNNTIDLEGLAHHRGSAFGRHATPQPTQINFENNLAMALIRFMENDSSRLVIEDEGRNIGSVNFSKELFACLKSGSRVVVETPMKERIAITLDEYVVQAQKEYANINDWEAFMRAAMQRIQKRLGGERYQRVLSQFDFAMQAQLNQNSIEEHQAWIETLLAEYYDPMYDYQMQKNNHSVTFKGSIQEVVEYLK